jgi:co-chaperonin GroES (HSP10)
METEILEIEIKGNFILVEPIEMPHETSGGIFIPTSVKAPRRGIKGRITQVGDHKDDERLVVGALVLFNQYGGTKVNYQNGKECYVLKSTDLFGLID